MGTGQPEEQRRGHLELNRLAVEFLENKSVITPREVMNALGVRPKCVKLILERIGWVREGAFYIRSWSPERRFRTSPRKSCIAPAAQEPITKVELSAPVIGGAYENTIDALCKLEGLPRKTL